MVVTKQIRPEEYKTLHYAKKTKSNSEFLQYLADTYSSDEVGFKKSNVLRYNLTQSALSIVIIDVPRCKIKIKDVPEEVTEPALDENGNPIIPAPNE